MVDDFLCSNFEGHKQRGEKWYYAQEKANADVMLVRSLRRWLNINPFKPEFTIVIFIDYKPRIAIAILDL